MNFFVHLLKALLGAWAPRGQVCLIHSSLLSGWHQAWPYHSRCSLKHLLNGWMEHEVEDRMQGNPETERWTPIKKKHDQRHLQSSLGISQIFFIAISFIPQLIHSKVTFYFLWVPTLCQLPCRRLIWNLEHAVCRLSPTGRIWPTTCFHLALDLRMAFTCLNGF